MSAEERKIALSAARKVRNMLDRGQTVLVTCHAGLNRSGLISGLALMLPSTGMSITPGCLTSMQAIYAIRRARGSRALSNPQFVRMLERAECLCPSRNQMA